MPACRNDVPQEYSGEDETISAVGLVRPKPGIFVPAIQYLLVVCTTIEVHDLSLCIPYISRGHVSTSSQAFCTLSCAMQGCRRSSARFLLSVLPLNIMLLTSWHACSVAEVACTASAGQRHESPSTAVPILIRALDRWCCWGCA